MSDLNLTVLAGHLGTDPTKLPIEDKDGAKFRLATNETRYSAKEKQRITLTEWHNVKCFNQNARYVLENVRKSDHVLIVGNLHYHKYNVRDDKGNEIDRGRNSEIIAYTVRLLNRSKRFHLEEIAKKLQDNKIAIASLLTNNEISEDIVSQQLIELMY